MKKLLLVDDEILVRESIRDRISWENEGFEYCGDAPDGELALPMIERLHPDILVTDIKMPFMDGLQLSKIVKERIPDIKIVILSGHDEFQYAREALRIGVEEYCLKPINAAELLKVLHQVSAKIDAKRLEKQEWNALQMQVIGNKELSKEKLLLDLCTGSVATAEAIQTAEELHIPLIADHYAVVIAHFEKKTEEQGNVLEEEPLQQELLHVTGGHLHVKRNKVEHAWIVKGGSLHELEQDTNCLVKRLKLLEERISCSIVIGVGKVKNRIQDISISYSEADQHKSYLLFLRRHSIVSLSAEKVRLRYDRNQVTNFLKFGDVSKVEEFAGGYIAQFWNDSQVSPFYRHYLIADMTAAAIQYIHDSGGDVQGLLKDMEPLEAELLNSQRLTDMQSCAADLLKLVLKRRDHINDKYSDLLRKAKEYIAARYDQPDISLQSVAGFVCVSPSHFSTIFSQVEGQTFIEYLIKTRIHKAMELLRTTNAKSYEIAAMVGYNDPHYFNSLFKKITGMTTKAFRYQRQ